MSNTVKIYGVYGFLGDQLQAPINELCFGEERGAYIVADFLSEDTYQILKKLKTDHFFPSFLDTMLSVPVLRSLYAKNMKFICNAGALNPRACAEMLAEKLKDNGIPLKVAYIDGDNLGDAMETFEYFPNSKTGLHLDQSHLPQVISATVYLGSEKIAEALKNGADIVIAGRVTDAGMALGAMLAKLPWKYGQDWDKLATGIIGGHMLSCGGQSVRPVGPGVLGVPEMARISYPYVEIDADANLFVGSRTPITVESVSSQMFYGIAGERYIDPDVIVSLTEIELTPVNPHRIRISGVKGLPKPEKLRAIVLMSTGVHTLTAMFQVPKRYMDAYGSEQIQEIIRLRMCAGGVLLEPQDFQVQQLGTNATDGFLQVHAKFSNPLYAKMAKGQLPSLIVTGFNGAYGNVPHLEEEVMIWDSLISRDKVEERLTLSYLGGE